MVKDVIENNKEMYINKEKIDGLKELFPNCFSDEGKFDIASFEKEIKQNVDITKEGYFLDFLGKQYAKLIASLDTESILVPDEENNIKEENKNSENIYISGDNIDALKHLVKSYSNKIKCIYIDPPYNTGEDGFAYNDNFNFTIKELVDKLDINEEEATRVLEMTNKNSNSHSAWLTFMYPRLYVAKKLLTNNGVIFISIDDNEQSNLTLLCDNIFGEENKLGILPRITKKSGKDHSDTIAKNHDYLLIYAKNYEEAELVKNEVSNESYSNSDEYEKERGKYKLNQTLDYNSLWYNPKMDFPLEIDGKVFFPGGSEEKYRDRHEGNHNSKDWVWRWSKSKFEFGLENGFIVIKHGKDRDRIYTKTYLNATISKDASGKYFIEYKDRKSTTSSLTFVNNEYSNDNAKKELNKYDMGNDFEFPKPSSLILKIIQLLNTEEDFFVLDFFGGSATTADAVLQFNADSNNENNCRFILVQLQEKSKNSKFKTIDEIGQERIRRAARRIKEETNEDIDYGFKHYKIQEIQTKTLDKLENFEPNYILSDGDILNDFGKNSVLTTWMNEDGYGLKDKYETIDLEGYEAYKCKNTIYLLNKNISSESIKCLMEKYEEDKSFDCDRIVLFGYSFNLNEIQTLKDNLKQVKNIKDISVDVITRY